MPNASVKQLMTDAIQDKLELISIANGYNTDIGTNVFHWRISEFSEAELPAVNIRSTNSRWETLVSFRHSWTVEYEIEAVAHAPTEAGATLNDLEADLMQALGAEPRIEQTFGTSAARIAINDCEHFVKQGNITLAGVRLKLTAFFSTKLWEPTRKDLETVS